MSLPSTIRKSCLLKGETGLYIDLDAEPVLSSMGQGLYRGSPKRNIEVDRLIHGSISKQQIGKFCGKETTPQDQKEIEYHVNLELESGTNWRMTTCVRHSGAASSILPPVTAKAPTMKGRAAIRMDGVEVLRSNYYTYFENVWSEISCTCGPPRLKRSRLRKRRPFNQAHAYALEAGHL